MDPVSALVGPLPEFEFNTVAPTRPLVEFGFRAPEPEPEPEPDARPAPSPPVVVDWVPGLDDAWMCALALFQSGGEPFVLKPVRRVRKRRALCPPLSDGEVAIARFALGDADPWAPVIPFALLRAVGGPFSDLISYSALAAHIYTAPPGATQATLDELARLRRRFMAHLHAQLTAGSEKRVAQNHHKITRGRALSPVSCRTTPYPHAGEPLYQWHGMFFRLARPPLMVLNFLPNHTPGAVLSAILRAGNTHACVLRAVDSKYVILGAMDAAGVVWLPRSNPVDVPLASVLECYTDAEGLRVLPALREGEIVQERVELPVAFDNRFVDRNEVYRGRDELRKKLKQTK